MIRENARNLSRSIVLTMMVTALFALGCRDAAGFSATPKDMHDFEELMAVAWLTCTFKPVETVSGDVLERIEFDADDNRTRIVTATLDKVDMRGVLNDEESPFGGPMTLVFDTTKTQARLLPPVDPPPNSKHSLIVSSVDVQRASWLNPGALQTTIIFTVTAMTGGDSSFVINVVIFPAKTAEGAFAGIANLFINMGMFVVSARCTTDINEVIRPEVKRIRLELEATETEK